MMVQSGWGCDGAIRVGMLWCQLGTFLYGANCVLYQVNLCFDQMVYKLSEQIFQYYKQLAAK